MKFSIALILANSLPILAPQLANQPLPAALSGVISKEHMGSQLV
jgi:hypothetical protein